MTIADAVDAKRSRIRVWTVAAPAIATAQGSRSDAAHEDGAGIAGWRIGYRGEAGETAVSDPDGRAGATILAVRHLRAVREAAPRPAMVLFDGGPGPRSDTIALASPCDDPPTRHRQVAHDPRAAVDGHHRDAIAHRPIASYVRSSEGAAAERDRTPRERYRRDAGAVLRAIVDRSPKLPVPVAPRSHDPALPGDIRADDRRAARLPGDGTGIASSGTGHGVFDDDGPAGADAVAEMRSIVAAPARQAGSGR